MITKNIHVHKEDNSDELYYICVKTDPEAILFQCSLKGIVGGCIHDEETVLKYKKKYKSYTQAQEEIKKLYKDNPVFRELELAVLRLHRTDIEEYTTFIDTELDALYSSNELLMKEFEELLVKVTSWSPNALQMLRSVDCTKYDHTGVQASFEQYCTMKSSLPEK